MDFACIELGVYGWAICQLPSILETDGMPPPVLCQSSFCWKQAYQLYCISLADLNGCSIELAFSWKKVIFSFGIFTIVVTTSLSRERKFRKINQTMEVPDISTFGGLPTWLNGSATRWSQKTEGWTHAWC